VGPRFTAALAAPIAFLGLVAAPSFGQSPPTISANVVSRVSGDGRLKVSATTGSLQSGLWLQQVGGTGTGRGRATISCEPQSGSTGTGAPTSFSITTRPGEAQRQLWRPGGGDCTVEVRLRARGHVVVELRGH
jgi:hypothetical protein